MYKERQQEQQKMKAMLTAIEERENESKCVSEEQKRQSERMNALMEKFAVSWFFFDH